jgi:TRAP-type transport system small permease protein
MSERVAGDEPLEGGEAPARSGFVRAIESLEQVVMNVAFVVVFMTIVWSVLSRYVVPNSATWAEEVTGIAFAWLIFVGAAEVHRRAQHVGVDLLTSSLPRPAQRALAFLVDLFVVVFCFYVAYLGAREAIAVHSSTTSMLRVPLSVSFGGLVLGLVLMGLRGVQRLWPRARAAFAGRLRP